ncbi:MAG: hypothetical protein EOO65_02605, partial [Methanosarcinales archaeon]
MLVCFLSPAACLVRCSSSFCARSLCGTFIGLSAALTIMLRAATQTLRSVAPVSRALIARSAGAAAAVRAAVPHASPRVRFFAAAAAAAAPASSYIMLNESTQSLSSILSSATPNTLVVAYFTARYVRGRWHV